MARIPAWKIEDVLDLEACFEADAGVAESTIAGRDRRIHETMIAALPAAGDLSASRRMRLWLEARRQILPQPSPGTTLRMVLSTVTSGLFAVGALVGMSLASVHLLYRDRPISVTAFFATTVLWQILLLIVTLVAIVSRRRITEADGGWIRSLVNWLVSGLAKLKARAEDVAGGDSRSRFAAAWGALRARTAIYGNLALWPLVRAMQVFVIGLNLGLIAMLLWLVVVSNRAFGWETTLNVQPESVSRIVEVISLPWSWLPNAYPTAEQVAESRIALHGPASYSADALRSWWPFLCYAVVFYGLLPRVLLWIVATVGQARALKRIDFRHGDCSRVLRRMTPLVVSGEPPPARADAGSNSPAPPPAFHGEAANVFVSRELNITADEIADALAKRGLVPAATAEIEIDCASANEALFASLESDKRPTVVMVENGRPPVKAILETLRQLRASLGTRDEVLVVTVGGNHGTFDYFQSWSEAVAGLGDPYMRAEPS